MAKKSSSGGTYGGRKTDAHTHKPADKPDLSRRGFLKCGLALAALGVEEATVGVVRKTFGKIFDKDTSPGKTKVPSAGNGVEAISPKIEELTDYMTHEPPHIAFTNTMPKDKPKLPEGIEESETDKVAEKLREALKDHFSRNKEDLDSEMLEPVSVLNVCVQTLQAFNPAFGAFIQKQNEATNKDPFAFIRYVNLFLIKKGYYLFVDFHVTKYTDLHNIQESGSIVVNDKPNGKFFVLDAGIINSPGFDINGLVIPEMPDTVHLWPHRNKTVVDSYRVSFGDEAASEFAEAVKDGFKYHESMHVYLEDKYPHGKVPLHSFVSKNFEVIPGLTISIGGQFGPDDLQELCAVGAQLARSSHPHEILPFIGNPTPGYDLQNRILVLAALKAMPEETPVRESNIASLKSASTNLNPSKINEYFKGNAEVEVVRRVGQIMYSFGIEMFEDMFAKE